MAIDEKNSEIVAQDAHPTQKNFDEEQKLNFEKLRKKTEALEMKLYEREQQLQQQQMTLDQMQNQIKPKPKDDFDDLPDDELIDKARLKKILDKERSLFKEEAIKSAKQTYEAVERENYAFRLKTTYPDYESVVNEENAKKLQDEDPEFVTALAKIDDAYLRRELAYKKMKRLSDTESSKFQAQQVIDENKNISRNFMTSSGQHPMGSNPHGFEFNTRDPEARRKAYERLRAAQKRGI